ncbi:MAG: hypothetical protein LH630_10155 [Actinomycetia bacterium]|nr:hypothetical protein [Actinomycetes bacterium]
MIISHPITALIRFGAALTVAGIALSGCSSSPTPAATPTGSTSNAGGNPTAVTTDSSQVLPVQSNPIKNDATAQTLKIDSVLVENNVNPSDGSAVDDHLEIALSNTGSKTLTGFEIFYTFTDPTAKTSESYYAQLPPSFTISTGEARVAHFDNTGEPDHFPSNKYSLYATSKNGLDVSVTVSAAGAAEQTATVKKDPGGDEQAD